jgi:hypothetical protein
MDKLKINTKDISNRAKKITSDISNRVVNFLTSDYAKLLGEKALYGILSLLIIGGLSVSGFYSVDKLQKIISKNITIKNDFSKLIDIAKKHEPKPKGMANRKYITELVDSIIHTLKNINQDLTEVSSSKLPDTGKGFNITDFKKKFKQASNKVYSMLTSDEAKAIGTATLTSIILASMGYGVNKFLNKANGAEDSEEVKNAKELEMAIKSKDDARITEAIKKNLMEGDKFPKSKTLSDLENEFNKKVVEFTANPKSINNPINRPKTLGSPGEPELESHKWAPESDIEKDIDDDINLVIHNLGLVAKGEEPTRHIEKGEFYDDPFAYETKSESGSEGSDWGVTILDMLEEIGEHKEDKGPGLKPRVLREPRGIFKKKQVGGGGMKSYVAKFKNYISKVIKSKEAKGLGAAALSILILAGLGGLGGFAYGHFDNESKKIINKAYLDKLKTDWEDTNDDNNKKTSHFEFALGLKGKGINTAQISQKTSKFLKSASKKITEIIKYAIDSGLDKMALYSLITVLLSLGGYGSYSAIHRNTPGIKDNKLDPQVNPEDWDGVMDAIDAYKNQTIAERVSGKPQKSTMDWEDLFEKTFAKGLKGGDLSKFGKNAKEIEENKKNAKPLAKKITDMLYTDEAKLIGSSVLQYAILTALGLLVLDAGSRASKFAASKFPEDTSKFNDPNLFNNIPGLAPPSETDIAMFESRPKYATKAVLSSVFKGLKSDEILNLKRYALEHPKNKAVKEILESNDATIYDDYLLRSDPYLATIFHTKAPIKEAEKYYKNPDYVKKLSQYEQTERDINNKKWAQAIREGEIEGDFLTKSKKSGVPEEEPHLREAEETKSSAILTPEESSKNSVRELIKKFSGKGLKLRDLRGPQGKETRDKIANTTKIATKKINEVGNTIYKIITSNDIKQMSMGVIVGLIVSALGIIMKDKYDTMKATKKSNELREPERILGDISF